MDFRTHVLFWQEESLWYRTIEPCFNEILGPTENNVAVTYSEEKTNHGFLIKPNNKEKTNENQDGVASNLKVMR